MAHRLTRLLRPRSIAVVGGGTWCEAVVEQNRKLGFEGPIWPVHPTRETIAGQHAFRDLDALPDVPDAVFVGVNRHATVDIVARLDAMGAGGVVCFASGFREFTVNVANNDLVRVTGYMVRLSDIRKFRDKQGSRTNTTVLGAEAAELTGILDRKPRVVGNELYPGYGQ